MPGYISGSSLIKICSDNRFEAGTDFLLANLNRNLSLILKKNPIKNHNNENPPLEDDIHWKGGCVLGGAMLFW